MNQDPSLASWSDHVPEDSLISGSGEDFSNILDFEFDLADLESAVDQHGRAITTSASQTPASMVHDTQLTGMEGIETTQPHQYPTSFVEQMRSIDMQGVNCMQSQVNQTSVYFQKQQQQPQQGIMPQSFGQPHQFVPPTPNSTELHGGVGRYPPQLDSATQRHYEPYTRATDDPNKGTISELGSARLQDSRRIVLRFPIAPNVGNWRPGKTVSLSETPKVPSRGWDAASIRIVTIGVFTHRGSRKTVLGMSTHLDDQGSKSRHESAKLILKKVDEYLHGEYKDRISGLFLAGDFNSKVNQEAYQVFIDPTSPLLDARDQVKPGDRYGNEITYTGFGYEGEPATRIDYILVGPRSEAGFPWTVNGYAVLPNRFDDGVLNSDHRAVVADAVLD
ncbi:conserved hypothetical protein [Uncinocarpus reesii 1704]|uniref:Endonuclease/exonuclease/phosphatase domain-containing protein n=1 Tax=Uncinocarpus reesii (strain UAMH 1704) TaxID=336963 RepID=C4JUR7_UNCRE|nr:uncharacterized protein UREG_04870 [Uncinocarpus reesii 1704]EEP80028.1 conserved hypothetical protein [Uncinocarpus reesii 1704]